MPSADLDEASATVASATVASASPRAGRARRAKADEGPRATFRQLLPYLFEHKRTLAVVVVLSILSAGASLVQPLLVGQVITRVQAGLDLGLLVWALVGFVILASLISGWQHYLLQRTGTAVVYSSRRRLIARILHLPISEFDARRTGDLVSRVGSDTTLLYAALTQGLADSIGNALLFVGALVAMAVIDPVLLGIIVVVIGVSIAGVAVLSGRIRTASTEQQEKVGELASGVERAVGSIRTVRAAGATEREVDAVTARATDAYTVGVRIARVSALVVPIAGIALQVSLLVVIGLGGFRVATGALSIASLVTFIMFLFMLIAPLGSFFGAITSVSQALGALGRIQEVLDLPTESADDAAIAARVADVGSTFRITHSAEPGPENPQSARFETREAAPAIEFRDVRFHYPENVVVARRTAESEALAMLESAHVDTSAIGSPDREAGGGGGGGGALPPPPPPTPTCCGACRSRCPAGRASRSSAHPVPARARRSRSSSGSTTRRAARSSSTARTCARLSAARCARSSAMWSRTPPRSPARSATTCDSPRRRRSIPNAKPCCAP